MPQILGIVLVGAAAWAGYRWLRREMGSVAADLSEAEEALRKRRDRAIPTLRRDPETGVYKPDRS